MKVEDIAALELARLFGFAATSFGAELARLQKPREHAQLARVIQEAEQRGEALGRARQRAESVDGGPIPAELTGCAAAAAAELLALTAETFDAVARMVRAERDRTWANAFKLAGAFAEVGTFPTNPYGVQGALAELVAVTTAAATETVHAIAADAAAKARRAERDACREAAFRVGAGHAFDAGLSAWPFGGKFRHLAAGAYDVAEAILDRDTADVPTPDQADAGPLPQGD